MLFSCVILKSAAGCTQLLHYLCDVSPHNPHNGIIYLTSEAQTKIKKASLEVEFIRNCSKSVCKKLQRSLRSAQLGNLT